jgi:hypothetical protein
MAAGSGILSDRQTANDRGAEPVDNADEIGEKF